MKSTSARLVLLALLLGGCVDDVAVGAVRDPMDLYSWGTYLELFTRSRGYPGFDELGDWTPCGDLLPSDNDRIFGTTSATRRGVQWSLTVDGETSRFPSEMITDGESRFNFGSWGVAAGKRMHLRGELRTWNPDARYIVEVEREALAGLQITARLNLFPACVDLSAVSAPEGATFTRECPATGPCGQLGVLLAGFDALDHGPLPRPAEGNFVLTKPSKLGVWCGTGARWGDVEAALAPYLADGSLSFDLTPTSITGPDSDCGDLPAVYGQLHDLTRISGLLLRLAEVARGGGPIRRYEIYREEDWEAISYGE